MILECFNGYKTSVLNDDGKAATGYLDRRTMQYYEKFLNLIKRGTKTEI